MIQPKKKGLDVMIGIGAPKAPRPPDGMNGPMPPDDGMDQSDDEGAETGQLDKIEHMLTKICEALGIDMAQYEDKDGEKPPMGGDDSGEQSA